MRWTSQRQAHLRKTTDDVTDGQAVWSWRPDAGVKFADRCSRITRMTVARKPGSPVGSPGRSRISRKTIRAGKAGCSG
jgi:hypothetical protein